MRYSSDIQVSKGSSTSIGLSTRYSSPSLSYGSPFEEYIRYGISNTPCRAESIGRLNRWLKHNTNLYVLPCRGCQTEQYDVSSKSISLRFSSRTILLAIAVIVDVDLDMLEHSSKRSRWFMETIPERPRQLKATNTSRRKSKSRLDVPPRYASPLPSSSGCRPRNIGRDFRSPFSGLIPRNLDDIPHLDPKFFIILTQYAVFHHEGHNQFQSLWDILR